MAHFSLFKSVMQSWLEDICMLDSGLIMEKICALYSENILIKPMGFMNMKQAINVFCLFKSLLMDDNILNWNRRTVFLKYLKLSMLNVEKLLSNFKVDSVENSMHIFILCATISTRDKYVCKACNLK